MKIKVKGCFECPFKRRYSEGIIKCSLVKEEITHNVLENTGYSNNCPLILQSILIELNGKS